jgi:hypothetical protein
MCQRLLWLLWLLPVPQMLLVLIHQTPQLCWLPVLMQGLGCGHAQLPGWQQLCHVAHGFDSCLGRPCQQPRLLLLNCGPRVQVLLSCLLLQLLLLWILRCCLLLLAWLLLLLLRQRLLSTAGGCWSHPCCWTAASWLC